MSFPTIVDVSEKGQILIPAPVRKALGIEPKGKVVLIPKVKDKKIEIEPIKKGLT